MSRTERVEERVADLNPLVGDSALAVVFAIAAVVTISSQEVVDGLVAPGPVAYITAVVSMAPIAIRRRWPLAAVIVASVATLIHVASHAPEGSIPFGLLVLAYSVAAWAPLARAAAGFGCLIGTLLVISRVQSAGLDAIGVSTYVVAFAAAWASGLAIRTRREKAEARIVATQQQADAERERAERAVLDERLLIAQELHDVMAHSMSVIAVQAGVGMHLLDRDPERSRAALEAISDTSRSTLSELRRLLGVLRDGEGVPSDRPAPTLEDLDQLVEDMRAIGLPVTLDLVGSPSPVQRGVQMSAYRIVQEALTNVVKHAGRPSAVDVRLTSAPDRLVVQVSDDGRGLAADRTLDHPGHGIIGMRERVEVWGGRLDAGPLPGGGFTVRAELPLEGTS